MSENKFEIEVDNNETEFYDRLKTQLENDIVFPDTYLFKFVVPNEGNNVNDVENQFVGSNATITKRESSNGNFIALSIAVTMKSANEIISIYKGVSHIKGIVSL